MKRYKECVGRRWSIRSLVILCVLSMAFPSQGLGMEKREFAGKTYSAQEHKWYQEFQGSKYEVHPQVITVKFKKGLALASKRTFEAQQGFNELRENRLGYVDIEIPAGSNPLDVVQQLQADGVLEYAEINTLGRYLPVGDPDDQIFPDQWHLEKTQVSPNEPTGAWGITTGSNDVVVAVLDSGTDIGHEDLIGNIWVNPGEDADSDGALDASNPDHLDNDDKNGADDDGNGFVDDLAGWDFVNNNNDVLGPFFHGTHVAGIIGAMTNNGQGLAGVAGGFGPKKGVSVMAVGVGDNAPDGSILDDAIIYAADNGAKVITLSLTVGSSQAIDDAIDYAVNQKGVFMNNAAGNSSGPVGYPATNPNVVAVSSTDKNDVLSTFSNRGPEIELAAPGEEIWSTQKNNNYGEGDGTSYASPQVAGLAGLLLSCDPTLSQKKIRTIMHDSAVDLGDSGKDDLYGFGRIDALAALKSVNCMTPMPEAKYQYSAKVVCGIQKNPDDRRLARGLYATAINIHNPNQTPVKFNKILAMTYPPKEQRPGKVLPIATDTLKPGEALAVDCPDIQQRLFPNGFPTSYIKGFVVIKSPESLDVTGVYTATNLEGDNPSIDVEQIQEREMKSDRRLPDLVVKEIRRPAVSCPGGGGTCVTKTSITVANDGMQNAGSFKVRIVLDPTQGVIVTQSLSGLAAGDMQSLTVTTPPGGNCFDPDCTISATVDSDNSVNESNEGNNTRSETTLG
ncbi:S8 family serine peptidase [Nitrospira sp. M1]